MSHYMSTDEKIDIMSGRAEQELAEKKLQIAAELQTHHDRKIEKRQARAQVAGVLGTGGVLPTVTALTPHEKKNYSLAKALQAEAANEKGLTLEREISESIAKDIGQIAAHGGIWVPLWPGTSSGASWKAYQRFFATTSGVNGMPAAGNDPTWSLDIRRRPLTT